MGTTTEHLQPVICDTVGHATTTVREERGKKRARREEEERKKRSEKDKMTRKKKFGVLVAVPEFGLRGRSLAFGRRGTLCA